MSDYWVFYGVKASFASAVFENEQIAFETIKKYSLTGLLTCYPSNRLVYEWAIENEYFKVKRDHQKSPAFIGSFTSGSQNHYHFEEGEMVS
jgi:hypothetical protein